ncbi:RanGTP-binding protein-domain-containing protein [Truncatella angustata]|uniref:RanGTP-binding protein-domain-containing protein n=1 Tax=Truncatella angustata TaxID=152316 RepID=A0A9P8UCJ4_9PEZI|nr:RanGTP-binding protein-domain-containing protein [Truncatella angustata]KAH6647524.1 RanGTP-binding protein-domain-containing protein [Truncatella angustata]
MDAFLARVSYHATSYAIRSCLALTSTLVIQQGSRLLKTVDDHPLRAELAALQRRLARKIELVSPILESIEFRYTRGNSALEAVVRVGRELRDEIDALTARYQDAATLEEQLHSMGKKPSSQDRGAELRSILTETKQLMASIDDLIPSINLWVSAIGGIQPEQASFSPSRLLQASMVVNVGDSQFVLAPSRPMQIGPDFTLSLYMLFRGHAFAQNGEAYGVEEGQRKPMWQEVIHKSRVRLYRVPTNQLHDEGFESNGHRQSTGYAYQLQIVEDLDDGRVHTFEDGNVAPGPYDGMSLAGVREVVPVGQISKMFYADVGRILNINNEDGASSNPVLLLKRDTSQIVHETHVATDTADFRVLEQQHHLVESIEEASFVSDSTLSEPSPQDDIDRQLREESQAAEVTDEVSQPPQQGLVNPPLKPSNVSNGCPWTIPHNIDPEWMAMEVFEFDDSGSSTDDEDEERETDEDGASSAPRTPRPHAASRTSVDKNLITQLQRMRVASNTGSSSPPSSSHSYAYTNGHEDVDLSTSTELMRQPRAQDSAPLSPTTIERSPFGAIRTSLSLLEMLLRLTSLQEFEQMTHLSIPDHVLKFYLDESASESGLHGKERWAARAEAAKKMGFDPYVDGPEGGGSGPAGF